MECMHSIYSYTQKGDVHLKQKNLSRHKIKSPYPYSLVIPAFLVYAILYVIPAASGFLLSFFNIKTFKISSFTFAGIENYATVLRNPYFSVAIKNTLLFAVFTTLGKLALGMSLALLVHNRFRGVNYMRTVFFLPAVLNNVAVGLVFRSMMHPIGLINRTLTGIGLETITQNWLTNPKIAIFSCAFVEIWKWTGYTMVILLAGLQAIDSTYYEAAELDGANRRQKFYFITLPLIMPSFNNAVVISIVGGLKVFDIVQSLTNGGPGNATSVFGTLIYSSFSSGNYGRGCAASMILTIFVLLIALPTNRFLSGKEVEL